MIASSFQNAMTCCGDDLDLINEVWQLYDHLMAANFSISDPRDPEITIFIFMFTDGTALLQKSNAQHHDLGHLIVEPDNPNYEEQAETLLHLAEEQMAKHPEAVED